MIYVEILLLVFFFNPIKKKTCSAGRLDIGNFFPLE